LLPGPPPASALANGTLTAIAATIVNAAMTRLPLRSRRFS
jgi:hypothetical protein